MIWIKLDHDTGIDPKIASMPLAQQAVFYNLLQAASKSDPRGSVNVSRPRLLALEVAASDVKTLQAAIDHLVEYEVLRRESDRVVFVNWEKHQSVSDDVRRKRSEAGKLGASARWPDGPKMANATPDMANAILPMAKDGKNGRADKEGDRDIEGEGDIALRASSPAQARARPSTTDPFSLNGHDPRIVGAMAALHLAATESNYQSIARACTSSPAFASLSWDDVARQAYASQAGQTIRYPGRFMERCLEVEVAKHARNADQRAPPADNPNKWEEAKDDPVMIRHREALEEKRKKWRSQRNATDSDRPGSPEGETGGGETEAPR